MQEEVTQKTIALYVKDVYKRQEQRYKDHAYHGYTSTGHELLHALALY